MGFKIVCIFLIILMLLYISSKNIKEGVTVSDKEHENVRVRTANYRNCITGENRPEGSKAIGSIIFRHGTGGLSLRSHNDREEWKGTVGGIKAYSQNAKDCDRISIAEKQLQTDNRIYKVKQPEAQNVCESLCAHTGSNTYDSYVCSASKEISKEESVSNVHPDDRGLNKNDNGTYNVWKCSKYQGDNPDKYKCKPKSLGYTQDGWKVSLGCGEGEIPSFLEDDNYEQCKHGEVLVNKKCEIAKPCACPAGTPDTGCEKSTDIKCIKCDNDEFALVSDMSCQVKCGANNGTAKGTCMGVKNTTVASSYTNPSDVHNEDANCCESCGHYKCCANKCDDEGRGCAGDGSGNCYCGEKPGDMDCDWGVSEIMHPEQSAEAATLAVGKAGASAVHWTKGAVNTAGDGISTAEHWTKGAVNTAGDGISTAEHWTKGAYNTVSGWL